MLDNLFYQYFQQNQKKNIDKWHSYFDAYNLHFSRFINNELVFLEIGVQRGGSFQMWKDVLGSKAKIVGVDIDPNCKSLENTSNNMYIEIGDQSDVGFLETLVNKYGPFDIVLDDGGHTSNQMISSFLNLYRHVKNNGVYLVEDLHCAYWSDFNDYGFGMSFMDFAAALAPKLTWWHLVKEFTAFYETPPIHRNVSMKTRVPEIAKSTKSISFYESLIVFEKQNVVEPYRELR